MLKFFMRMVVFLENSKIKFKNIKNNSKNKNNSKCASDCATQSQIFRYTLQNSRVMAVDQKNANTVLVQEHLPYLSV